jgi:hypothetical protein
LLTQGTSTDGEWHVDDQGVLFTSPQTAAAWKPLATQPPTASAGQP